MFRKRRKIKGGLRIFMTQDKKMMVTINAHRTHVYIHNVETGKIIRRIKSTIRISCASISPDQKLLATKDDHGKITVFSVQTGEIIGSCPMAEQFGYPFIFTPDSKHILDFDLDGRTMLLDCATMTYTLLDGSLQKQSTTLFPATYIQYDPYTNQIYKLVADTAENTSGKIMVSTADIHNISYRVTREIDQHFPNHSTGISLCQKHNYYYDANRSKVIKTDKNFSEVEQISIPAELYGKRLQQFWVTPDEDYIFFNLGKQCPGNDLHALMAAKSLAYLFEFNTMKQIEKYKYDFISDFFMYENEKRYIIATWVDSYEGTINKCISL